MKTIEAKCKFCAKALTLKTDESYDEVGDQFKLLPLVACNRCADYMGARRIVLNAIKGVMVRVIQQEIRTDEDWAKVRELLGNYVKRYMRTTAEYLGQHVPPFEDEMVEDMIKSKGSYVNVLRLIRQSFNQQELGV